jgi:hypothetical protein
MSAPCRGRGNPYTAAWFWQPGAARVFAPLLILPLGVACPTRIASSRSLLAASAALYSRNQKGGRKARRFTEIFCWHRCPGRARPHPGFEGYFFFAFLAFFTFFAFFAFLAIASSFGLMEGNATRGMLGEGYSLATASNMIRADSRRAASRCHLSVIALSTVVMRFWRTFARAMRVARKSSCSAEPIGPPTPQRTGVNDASMSATRSASPKEARRIARQAVFTNSKPRHRLYRRGESPLSDAVAFLKPSDGEHHGRRFRLRGRDAVVRVLDWQC